jgi:hypothetical protein
MTADKPKGVYFPFKLAGSNCWQALSHTAHRLFGIMYAIRARSAEVFELNYGEIRKSKIAKNWIAQALRELEAAGVIARVRKGYGGPINARSGSLFRLAYLEPGPHAFEEQRPIEEWKKIFAAAREAKDTGHSHPRKRSKNFLSPLQGDKTPPGGVPFKGTRPPLPQSPSRGRLLISPEVYSGDEAQAGTRTDPAAFPPLPPELAALPWSAPRRNVAPVVWPVDVAFPVNEHFFSPRVIIRGEAVH